jgi:transcriptional regulator with XRE-family HTH domain
VTSSPRPLRVAERLKEARERQGLSVRQIADITKLSPHVVRALEDDRIDVLPQGIYRRAIVRACAKEVGLDAERELLAFLAEHPDELPLPGQTAYAEPAATRSGGWRRIFTAFGAFVPLAAGALYFAGTQNLAWVVNLGRVPESVDPPAILAPAHSEVMPAGGFINSSQTAIRPVVVLITVSSRCVLQVVADGRQVLARAMDPGEWLEVGLSEGIELLGDDAGAVQLALNGRPGRPLGQTGQPLSIRLGRDDYESFLADR